MTKAKQINTMAFILSAPRSGSTLLRLILNSNSKIFSPPELFLLTYLNMNERYKDLQNQKSSFREGLVEALLLAPNTSLSINSALKAVKQWEKASTLTKDIFHYLNQKINDLLLIDKTPENADDIAHLNRAENWIKLPLYIYISRHPLSVMDSYVRNNFYDLLNLSGDVWTAVEYEWFRYNDNILSFFKQIPSNRRIWIKYEDLVTQPDIVIRKLCNFLSVKFQPCMRNPYKSHYNKFTGLHQNSIMIGDPNIRNHSCIDSSLATAWERISYRWYDLCEKTKHIAVQLDYSER